MEVSSYRKPYRYYRKKKASALTVAQRKEVKSIVSKIDNSFAEQKYTDQYQLYTQIDRGGTLAALYAAIAQGTGQGTRVGDEIKPVKLEVRLSFVYNPNTLITDITHTYRVIIFQWHITTGLVAPTMSNILQYTGGVGDYRAVVSPIANAFKKDKDFTILYDKSFACNSGADPKPITIIKKMYNKIEFDSGGVTTATNLPYMLVVADDATGAHTPNVTMQFVSRLWYTDV